MTAATVRTEAPWTSSRPEGRWCGFGPYYAMFPVEFARQQVERFCVPGGQVLDPFCGRGTVPFIGQMTGRRSLGVDVNEVAWVFASVKLNPYADASAILKRVDEVLQDVGPDDGVSENEFQSLAWHAEVLGFLKAARRILDWKSSPLDRTLMGLILVHLHSKLGEGLSNQLRQAKSMAPDYSVRWWRARGMVAPRIDIRDFFQRKLRWRYAKGVPEKRADAEVFLGDARDILKCTSGFVSDFILTSPPYCGVTNYEYDNWIRLWMLGGPSLPSFKHAARFEARSNYRELIQGVFSEAKNISTDHVTAYVRTDARPFTLEVTIRALVDTWPEHSLLCRYDRARGPTQTALFGNLWNKAGEIDLLLVPKGGGPVDGFQLVRAA